MRVHDYVRVCARACAFVCVCVCMRACVSACACECMLVHGAKQWTRVSTIRIPVAEVVIATLPIGVVCLASALSGLRACEQIRVCPVCDLLCA